MFGYFQGRHESCHLEWCLSSHSYAWWLNCSTRCRHTKSWRIWKSLWSSGERPKTKVYWVSLCNDFTLKAKRCDGVNTVATLGSIYSMKHLWSINHCICSSCTVWGAFAYQRLQGPEGIFQNATAIRHYTHSLCYNLWWGEALFVRVECCLFQKHTIFTFGSLDLLPVLITNLCTYLLTKLLV